VRLKLRFVIIWRLPPGWIRPSGTNTGKRRLRRLGGLPQQNLADVLALYRAEGRFPTTKGASARERALGVWLHNRRQEAGKGVLSPFYTEGLSVIPGWDKPSTKKADEEARWKQRLAEVAHYRARGYDWPRHNKTDIKEERVLGVWLHGQRINDSAGRLGAAKKAQLDAAIPGWRQGRVRGRGRPQDSDQPASA
jgi:hypothetical protein